jgi:hypothetical protein
VKVYIVVTVTVLGTGITRKVYADRADALEEAGTAVGKVVQEFEVVPSSREVLPADVVAAAPGERAGCPACGSTYRNYRSTAETLPGDRWPLKMCQDRWHSGEG